MTFILSVKFRSYQLLIFDDGVFDVIMRVLLRRQFVTGTPTDQPIGETSDGRQGYDVRDLSLSKLRDCRHRRLGAGWRFDPVCLRHCGQCLAYGFGLAVASIHCTDYRRHAQLDHRGRCDHLPLRAIGSVHGLKRKSHGHVDSWNVRPPCSEKRRQLPLPLIQSFQSSYPIFDNLTLFGHEVL